MTARQVFEATMIELSKVQAPSLKLYEFNYLFNKAINQYVNKVYNVYDINQQTSDDLRVLKAEAYLTPTKITRSYPDGDQKSAMASKYSVLTNARTATYEIILPNDYLHMLNCVCVYHMEKQKDCFNKDSYVEVPAARLTADAWGMILDDVYNRPSPMKPYFYIHNVNTQSTVPTNPHFSNDENQGLGIGTDYNSLGTNSPSDNFKTIQQKITTAIKTAYISSPTAKKGDDGYIENDTHFLTVFVTESGDVVTDWKANSRLKPFRIKWYDVFNSEYAESYYWQIPDDIVLSSAEAILENVTKVERPKLTFNLSNTMMINGQEVSLVEKEAAHRYGNVTPVRCEIRYGKDDTVFKLVEVQVNYIKTPQYIRLTQEQIDLTEDTSQIMEFPDYVNQEIINELVHLVMEKTNDPRLSNNIQMTQTIARPTGQQQAPTQAVQG